MDVYVLSGVDESSNWPTFTQYVPNFAIRASWALLQPTSGGSIDLTNVGAAITAVTNAGFSGKVSLRVVAGVKSPSWGTWATVSDGSGSNIPVPWDTNYVSAYESFLTALASAISTAGYTFDHIAICPINGDNGELKLQGSLTDWNNVGYSITTYFNEFKNLTTKVHQAFSGLVNYISWTSKPMDNETSMNNSTLVTDMINWWQISPAGNLTKVGDMNNGGSGSSIQDFSSYTVDGIAWQAVSALGNTGVNNFLTLCSNAGGAFAEIYTGDISYVTSNY